MKPEDAVQQPVEVLYEARFLRLVRQGSWEYTQRHNASGIVALVPLTGAGEIVLVEQFRVPCAARVVELCAGLAGDLAGHEDEALELAAARELEEECGYRAAEVRRLSAGPNAAGSSNSVITFFLATGLTRVGDGGGDETEDIQVHVVPLAAAPAWLAAQEAAGRLIDPKIYAGLWFAERALRAPGGAA